MNTPRLLQCDKDVLVVFFIGVRSPIQGMPEFQKMLCIVSFPLPAVKGARSHPNAKAVGLSRSRFVAGVEVEVFSCRSYFEHPFFLYMA